MKTGCSSLSRVFLSAFLLYSGLNKAFGLAQVTLPHHYEDSVRIGIIWNVNAIGQSDCPSGTTPVGEQTRDFVLQSIGYNESDTTRGVNPANIRIGYSNNEDGSNDVTWDTVMNWWGGELPHVLVHVQAGWHSKNGPYIEELLDSAASLAIGVVSVGDDAAFFAENVFGFVDPINVPLPMGDARQYDSPDDGLWIDLDRASDTLEAPGIVRNTVDSILTGGTRIYFKPHEEDGRCQADADKFTLLPAFPTKFFGVQRAYDASRDEIIGGPIGGPDDMPVIAVYQDSLRRGVALSFQPQYLAHQAALEQIVYDAILYASFAHLVMRKTATPEALTVPPGQTSFESILRIVLTDATPNADIYYTTDGTPPDDGSSLFLPGDTLFLSQTTTIKAFAKALGHMDSDTLTVTFTRNATSSAIEIRDSLGGVLNGNIIHAEQTAYQIWLKTNYGGDTLIHPLIVSKAAGDRVTLQLDQIPPPGDEPGFARVYKQKFPFALGSANTGDTVLQANPYDTLIVTWTNPYDAGDAVRDTVIVQPGPVDARAYFSNASGDSLAGPFPEGTSPVYITVVDQIVNDNLNYQVTLTTQTGESEILTSYTKVDETTLRFQITANYGPIVPDDGSLQVNLGGMYAVGEFVTLNYTDPLYPADDTETQSKIFTGKALTPPSVVPAGGAWFTGDTTVVITPDSAFSGEADSVRYTIDSGAPTHSSGTVYSAPFQVSGVNPFVQAVAYVKHNDTNFAVSSVVVRQYNRRSQVPDPYADPDSTYFTEDTTISLYPAIPGSGDRIYYTWDGSPPDSGNSGQLYGSPLLLNHSDTLRFYAVNGPGVPSNIIREVYLKRDTLAKPTANPTGGNVALNTTIVLNHGTPGVQIYYTLNVSGREPDVTDNLFEPGTPIPITGPVVIRAKAFNASGEDKYVPSPVMTETYSPVLAVTANPGNTAFVSSIQVTLSANTTGATIYYTTDSTEPNNSSPVYGGGPLVLDVSTRLKAYAVKSGWVNSPVITHDYTRSVSQSVIQILDSLGTPFTDDFITGNIPKYSLQLGSHQAGTPFQPTVVSLNKDTVNLTLSNTVAGAFTFNVRNVFDIANGTANTGNGILEVKNFDTVIATWVNPRTAGDTARDTVYVRPANINAKAYFSSQPDGSDTVTNFSEGVSPIYVVVADQTYHPDSTYQVTLTTNYPSETETFELSPSGDKLVAAAPVTYNAIVPGNDQIESMLQGDNLKATYTDPIYGETVSGAANYAAKTIAAPTFTSSNGNPFNTSTNVTIVSTTGGVTFRYTTDGITFPDTGTGTAGSSLTITASTYIRAVAYIKHAEDNFKVSAIGDTSLNEAGDVGIPIATPSTSHFTDSVSVTLIPDDASDTIYYTTDNSDPTSSPSRQRYTAAIKFTASDTLNFYATNWPKSPSPIITEIYTKRIVLAPPAAIPSDTSFTGTLYVRFDSTINPSGTRVFYTTDGSLPDTTDIQILYTDSVGIQIPTTITARVFNPSGSDKYIPSDSASFAYNPILVVSASPGTGTQFTSSVQVTLSTNKLSTGAETDAVIYYTTDGSLPTAASDVATGPLTFNVTTTLQVFARDSGWVDAAPAAFTYTRSSTASRLEILDTNGTAFPGNIITGNTGRYSVKLYTHQVGASYRPVAVTMAGDAEPLALVTTAPADTFSYAFRDVFDFSSENASTDSNGTLEANPYDTIVVTWINSLTPGDTARDTAFIRPVNAQASLYFSTKPDGADTVTQFGEDTDTIYVVVNDQKAHNDSAYRVVLTTRSAERDTFSLTERGELLIAAVPPGYNPIIAGDGELQVLLGGDRINAAYVDPIGGDSTSGFADFTAKQVAAPTSDPADGAWFANDTTITLNTVTTGAGIRYATSRTVLSHPDSGTAFSPFVIAATTQIKAVAFLSHSPTNFVLSPELLLKLNKRDTVGNPRAEPPTSYFTEDTTVMVIAADTAADTVWYTTDGSSPDTSSTRTRYTAAVNLTQTTLFKFYAVNGNHVPSRIISETYTKRDTLLPPVAKPGDSTVFLGDTLILLSHPVVANAVIRYTLDNSTPTHNKGLPYLKGITTIKAYSPTTLKAVAFNPAGSDAWVQSPVLTAVYIPKVQTPVARPPDTSFISDVFVELGSPTFGSVTYFTSDDTTPDSNATAYSQPVRMTASGTLKARAYRAGWWPSDVMTAGYTKTFTPSVLQILDASGRRPAYFSELNTSFQVTVTTAETGSEISPLAATLARGDDELLTLASMGRNGERFRFKGPGALNLESQSDVDAEGILESEWYDTLVVTWANPSNSADTAADTMIVRPYPKNSRVYFSDSLPGERFVTQYGDSEKKIYIMVRDQAMPPGVIPSLLVTTLPTFGDRSADTLSTDLTLIAPGVYGVALAVDGSPAANPSDSLLQLLHGDFVTAFYRDPLDGDSATARAMFGEPGEVPALLAFTDSIGTVLADTVFWRPGMDSLYMVYVDDYTQKSQMVTLTVENTSGTGLKTYDTLSVELPPATQKDSVGTWRAAAPMAEEETPADNAVLEVFFHGVVIASITSHTKNGSPHIVIRDTLHVAEANRDESVAIRDTAGTSDNGKVTRATIHAEIIVEDQDFTSLAEDTILVNVMCLESGDLLPDLKLIQQPDGTYRRIIRKNEDSVDKSDTVLSCSAEDEIVVNYRDPVYQTTAEARVSWQISDDAAIHFEKPGGGVITSMGEYRDTAFVVVVKTASPTQDRKDTLKVTLVTDQGDTLNVPVVETAPFSGVFRSAPVAFTFSSEPSSENDHLEGKLDVAKVENTALVTASLGSDKSDLEVSAAFVPPEEAWIVDGNADGTADTIYIKFKKSLPELPREVTSIDWPSEGDNNFDAAYHEEADLSEIRFLIREDGSVDSSVIVIALAEDAFEFGKTSTSPDKPASLTLPDNRLFHGLDLVIRDKVRPVVVGAEKRPSDLNYYEDSQGKARKNPDTLIVTFSEKIIPAHRRGAPWDSLLLFMAPGADEDQVHRLLNLVDPVAIDEEEKTWLFVVTNDLSAFKPNVGDYVYMDPGAPFTDEAPAKNGPADRKAIVIGLDAKGSIHDAFVFIPVEGINPGDPDMLLVNGSFDADAPDILAPVNARRLIDKDGNETYVYEWIPPVGLEHNGSVDDNHADCGSHAEVRDFTPYPSNCLSTVKVHATDKYIAKISIFDHLGKFTQSMKQRFGYCGELENPYRETSQGLASWLVWNQKDTRGKYVGSGVYIWRVEFITPEKTTVKFYRQGIARSVNPQEGCATNGQ